VLVSPVTLVFLVELYQELTGQASPGRRQVWAFAAAASRAVGVGLIARQLYANAVALSSLPPQIRAQLQAATLDVHRQGVHALFRSIIPAVIWIGFRLVFWRDIAPLGRKWTRRLAFVLCLFMTVQVVNEIGRFLSGMHRYFADRPGRAVTLLLTQAQTQGGNAALTLTVHLIALCGSVRAGPQWADLTVHGGPEKAVCAYPDEHYEYWRKQLSDESLSWGAFGENLTTEGTDPSSVRVADSPEAHERYGGTRPSPRCRPDPTPALRISPTSGQRIPCGSPPSIFGSRRATRSCGCTSRGGPRRQPCLAAFRVAYTSPAVSNVRVTSTPKSHSIGAPG
jgi:hypothetical protein